jgi:hypothetical protein
MTKTFDLNKMGLVPMSEVEMQGVDGGDTGYYGKGADLSLAASRISNAAQQVANFVKPFVNVWNSIFY